MNEKTAKKIRKEVKKRIIYVRESGILRPWYFGLIDFLADFFHLFFKRKK